jgi:hypothetical protein
MSEIFLKQGTPNKQVGKYIFWNFSKQVRQIKKNFYKKTVPYKRIAGQIFLVR